MYSLLTLAVSSLALSLPKTLTVQQFDCVCPFDCLVRLWCMWWRCWSWWAKDGWLVGWLKKIAEEHFEHWNENVKRKKNAKCQCPRDSLTIFCRFFSASYIFRCFDFGFWCKCKFVPPSMCLCNKCTCKSRTQINRIQQAIHILTYWAPSYIHLLA